LCRFCVLDWTYIINGFHVQKSLHGFAKHSPPWTVLDKKNMRLIWANQVICDMVFGTARVDRSAFIKKPFDYQSQGFSPCRESLTPWHASSCWEQRHSGGPVWVQQLNHMFGTTHGI
jgi:hypothetical protein